MEDWLGTPQVVTVVIGVVAALIGVGVWVGGVNKDRTYLKENAARDRKLIRRFMDEIREDIDEIREDIKEIFMRLPDPYLGSASPVTLTKRGKEAAEKIQAHDWASRIASSLAERVEGKREFEVYEFCQDYVNEMYRKNEDPAMVDRVKEWAYEYGSAPSDLIAVLVVVLRDEVLKQISN